MSHKREAAGGGISGMFLLFIVFLILKLVGTIDWSWWWVTAPLWLPTVVALGIVILIFGIAFYIQLMNKQHGVRIQTY